MAGSPSTVKVERGALFGGVGEDDLVRERRLTAPGRAGDDVERVLRQSAPEDLIESRHAGGQLPDLHGGSIVSRSFRFATLTHKASMVQCYASSGSSGQASRTRRSVSGS